MIKTREELIGKFIEFFESKGHKRVPSASLIPENDPTVLFTTAGMHPLVPFLLGQTHPLGKRIVNVQKCIRTGDVEDVGDEVHHTFFEMLGNWSFGDASAQSAADTLNSHEVQGYFKEDAIKFSFEFLTSKEWLGIPIEKLAVSCFVGDENAPQDDVSAEAWKSLGIPEKRIAFLPKENNWWGPAGETGPCGPDTEMFFWTGKEKAPEKFDGKDKRWVEIWNDVFMQYEKKTRAILVDGMNCLYDAEFKVDLDLVNVLKKFNAKKIVVVNNHKEKAQAAVKEFGFDVFSFNGEIIKDNPEFFKRLFAHYKMEARDFVYFDHKHESAENARRLGVAAEVYKDAKQIEKFVKGNIGNYVPLEQKNVDTGMGVERTLAVLNGLDDNYLTSSFKKIIEKIEEISGRNYKGSKKEMRVIADHLRAAVFIIGDERGVKPGNVGQGYVLRRLIRRAIRYGRILGIEKELCERIGEVVVDLYKDYEFEKKKEFILTELRMEENRFRKTLQTGMKKFEELVSGERISGKDAFLLFQSYGFPIEMTVELAGEKGKEVDVEEFEKEFAAHQELSRTMSAGTFKSGLADDSERTTRLHTATHLLNEALRIVLGKEVKQKGSNITPERLRFDFNFPRKLTEEEIRKVEEVVNGIVERELDVVREEMTLDEAVDSGAQAEFGAKYPDVVSVYTILDSSDKKGWFSREICTGPHVKNTREVGKFMILKEESSAAGVRRIKASVD